MLITPRPTQPTPTAAQIAQKIRAMCSSTQVQATTQHKAILAEINPASATLKDEIEAELLADKPALTLFLKELKDIADFTA